MADENALRCTQPTMDWEIIPVSVSDIHSDSYLYIQSIILKCEYIQKLAKIWRPLISVQINWALEGMI